MKRSVLTIAALALVASTGLAAAADPTQIGTFQSWSAYTSNDPSGKMCFIASIPQSSKYSQTITSRDPVFFMITSIPSKKIQNEVSTIIGYGFGPNATVMLDVDGTQYSMFTANTDTAWAMPDSEAALVAALKNGSTLTVSAASKRGTTTTDTYSLFGITAALAKIGTECPAS